MKVGGKKADKQDSFPDDTATCICTSGLGIRFAKVLKQTVNIFPGGKFSSRELPKVANEIVT